MIRNVIVLKKILVTHTLNYAASNFDKIRKISYQEYKWQKDGARTGRELICSDSPAQHITTTDNSRE